MSLSSWNYLLIGLVGAIAVVFGAPLVAFLETVLAGLGVSVLVVIPAMALFLLALVLHQRALQAERDRKAQGDTELIADDARRAEERARELEQLVRLGEALGATLDPKAIHQTVKQHLQPVIGQRELWMTVRTEGWRLAIGGPTSSGTPPDQPWDPSRQPDAWETFPMFATGKLVGLMGVGQTVGDRP